MTKTDAIDLFQELLEDIDTGLLAAVRAAGLLDAIQLVVPRTRYRMYVEEQIDEILDQKCGHLEDRWEMRERLCEAVRVAVREHNASHWPLLELTPDLSRDDGMYDLGDLLRWSPNSLGQDPQPESSVEEARSAMTAEEAIETLRKMLNDSDCPLLEAAKKLGLIENFKALVPRKPSFMYVGLKEILKEENLPENELELESLLKDVKDAINKRNASHWDPIELTNYPSLDDGAHDLGELDLNRPSGQENKDGRYLTR